MFGLSHAIIGEEWSFVETENDKINKEEWKLLDLK